MLVEDGANPSFFYYNQKSASLRWCRLAISKLKSPHMQDRILVTGGAGFIGSNFILQRMQDSSFSIVNLDKLTYAGNLRNLTSIA